MKRVVLSAVTAIAISGSLWVQAPADPIANALLAAPAKRFQLPPSNVIQQDLEGGSRLPEIGRLYFREIWLIGH